MTDQLIETFEDGVATLTLNRPEARNALTGELLAALSEFKKIMATWLLGGRCWSRVYSTRLRTEGS